MVREIYTFAVFCSVTGPFWRFTRVYKGHFMLYSKKEFQVELKNRALWQIFRDRRTSA